MPQSDKIKGWCDLIRHRYESYLKTAFYFKDEALRRSFEQALQQERLATDAFPEQGRGFNSDKNAHELAKEFFPDPEGLFPALIDGNLYSHQSEAIRQVCHNGSNIVVATGTASGKTESFLYPVLFELFRQHQSGELKQPGVRALILYPMNALANDQRKRMGKICEDLRDKGSDFSFTFGQYIGETPEKEIRQNDSQRKKRIYPGEIVSREEMRKNPPHILLTNYSMLEYLLIRPGDSALFDRGAGTHWQFIILDEAHQYRGTKGMEMAMLIRRLKQRIRGGGRGERTFRCIATSATITSDESQKNRQKVAQFAGNLFDEKFDDGNIIFASKKKAEEEIIRYHTFIRALEGAFLLHDKGNDKIVLNRNSGPGENGEAPPEPLEIALCRDCGQHYYVGHVGSVAKGWLSEAARDPSDSLFGVTYLLPLTHDEKNIGKEKIYNLCKFCGNLSEKELSCHRHAVIQVHRCENHLIHLDQIKKCFACGSTRGNIGDPVQEIVHGADGPNMVIATALHEKLHDQCVNSENNEASRILAFADSRQDAAFFAWYAEDFYRKIRNRNLILRAMGEEDDSEYGLSMEYLKNRLLRVCEKYDIFPPGKPPGRKKRDALAMIYSELLTDDKRISLQATGLAKWYFQFLPEFAPKYLLNPPWNFSEQEATDLIQEILMELCSRGAVKLTEGPNEPRFDEVHKYKQVAKKILLTENGGGDIALLNSWGWSFRYLQKILGNTELSGNEKDRAIRKALKSVARACINSGSEPLWSRVDESSAYQLNLDWLHISPRSPSTPLFECDTCARIYFRNIRGVCPRVGCPGKLCESGKNLESNLYFMLYHNDKLPPALRSEEHTAQIKSEEARNRQEQFIKGEINLLSSSTTFEVGVNLSSLEAVFMRNVPPEPFNYIQRAGRAGRGEAPGIVVTYCRRNPHDLYHFENPEARIMRGEIRPPILDLKNEKIILRHIAATVFSLYFRKHRDRFKNLRNFVKDWKNPEARKDFHKFCCEKEGNLLALLKRIVPPEMHGPLLDESKWIAAIAGDHNSDGDYGLLAKAEKMACDDYLSLEMRYKAAENENSKRPDRIESRMKTIAEEGVLNFLSRKAIIPKYGFPVDVVELDIKKYDENRVTLQRDLSQAIAEYAPGSKVVADKLEWKSYGIKTIEGKEPPIFHYQSDEKNRNFQILSSNNRRRHGKKFIIPQFGFVTQLFYEPKPPDRRAQRLFTTRPYFVNFHKNPQNLSFPPVTISRPTPGEMVILCNGRRGAGFNICQSCYAGFPENAGLPEKKDWHWTPTGETCTGSLENFSLGQRFVTDVVRLQFAHNKLTEQWNAYSLAYALLLGAAQTLQLPDNDLNVTITGGEGPDTYAIILYDNVPGGAGLVANLCDEDILRETLKKSQERMSGECGCDSSCYGCLRSYRNQFAHPHLNRKRALEFLNLATEIK